MSQDPSLRTWTKALETTQLGVTIADTEGKILFANRADAEMHGYCPEELLGQDVRVYAPRELWNPMELRELRELRSRRRNSINIRRDGSTFPVRLLSDVVMDDDGEPIAVVTTCEDITQERDADLKLRMLTKALETTQLGVTVTDTGGTILFANRADAHMHGYEPQDLLDKDVRIFAPKELWSPMDVDKLRSMKSRRRETVNVRKDGGTFPVQLLSDVVSDEEGEPIAVVTTCEDITQRKEVERHLKILGKAFETTKLGVTVTDTDGKILYANPAEAEMHGCEVRDLINKDVRIFAPKELWNPMSKDQIRKIRAASRKTINVRQDGSMFPVQLTSDVVTDQEGEPIAVVTTCEDISLTTAIEHVAEAIMVTDPEGEIQYVNPAFERMTGYFAAEVIGRRWHLVRGADREEDLDREVHTTLTAGEVWKGRITPKRKDGGTFETRTTISPVRSPYDKIINFVFISHDITQEIEHEQQRRQSQKMEAIGQLAGGVAHDFNNLLLAIEGHTLFALENLPEDTPGRDDLQEVLKSAERAAALTRQLLAFSRRRELQPVDLHLDQVLQGLMKMLKRLIGENIEIRTNFISDLGIVHADPVQIEQVILNLCVNARDAMPCGGIMTLTTAGTEFDAEFCEKNPWARPGRFAKLAVTDTGVGMGDETINHVFEPFFTKKEVGEGTGLGLATVHGIVDQHEGLIKIDSHPGTGTRFEIYLPAKPAEEAEEKTPEVEAKPAGGTETLLVVEDDEVARRIVVRVLERAGYHVLVAVNGAEAVEIFTEHADEIALVLMDVVMPVMGGVAAREEILRLRTDARVLFTTGYNMEMARAEMLRDHEIALISKPFRPKDLLHKIREVLDA